MINVISAPTIVFYVMFRSSKRDKKTVRSDTETVATIQQEERFSHQEFLLLGSAMTSQQEDPPGCWRSSRETVNCRGEPSGEGAERRLVTKCERIRETVRHCAGKEDELVESVREETDGKALLGEALDVGALLGLGSLMRGLPFREAESGERRAEPRPPGVDDLTGRHAQVLREFERLLAESAGASARPGRGGTEI